MGAALRPGCCSTRTSCADRSSHHPTYSLDRPASLGLSASNSTPGHKGAGPLVTAHSRNVERLRRLDLCLNFEVEGNVRVWPVRRGGMQGVQHCAEAMAAPELLRASGVPANALAARGAPGVLDPAGTAAMGASAQRVHPALRGARDGDDDRDAGQGGGAHGRGARHATAADRQAPCERGEGGSPTLEEAVRPAEGVHARDPHLLDQPVLRLPEAALDPPFP